jgi:hypothetical protein
MKARLAATVLLVSILALGVSWGCRSDGRGSAERRQLVAAEAKWPNPFDEIRHYMDDMSADDQRVIQSSYAYSGEWRAEDAKLADAMKRNEKSIRGVMDVATSGRVEKYIQQQKGGSDASMEISPQTAVMRSAVRFLCNAAFVAHKSGDAHEASQRLAAAVRLAGAAGVSRSMTWHLIGYGCLVKPYDTAQTIYRESGIDESDASTLSFAFYNAAGTKTHIAALRSIWEDSDTFRDFNTYVAIYVTGPSGAGADTEAPSEGSESAAKRGGMNLGTKDLREQFRRDLEANDALRQRVLSTVSWPYYTLPRDEFWTELVEGRTGTTGFPMTLHAESFIAYLIESSNNELAWRALLDIVFQIRKFEAAKGRLPETLDELSSFVQESMKTGDVCFALLGFVDVYSGEAYRYTVAKDEAGKPASFKVYSVGIDLKDDGGVERPGLEGKEKGSDIVFEGRAVAGK